MDLQASPLSKCCGGCDEWVILDGFHRDARSSDGLQGRCKKCQSVQRAVSRNAHPERRSAVNRRARLKATYGITPEQYDEMLAAQGGGCATCGATEADIRGHRLHVDHCHATGRVRGLLCHNCNKAVGYAADDPERLRRLAAYLER